MSPADCDIILFDLTAGRGAESADIESVCVRNNIVYIWENPAFLGGLHIMNARLFLDQMLAPDYSEILYLDGDTQVVGDLTPLLEFSPRAGHLCAVRDPMVYLNGIKRLPDGFEAEIRPFGEDYVNSGVFRVNRHSWADISREALAQIGTATSALHFEDQTIINRVTEGRRDYASIRWNFPGFILGYGLEDIAQPSIVHFMSNPRPWQGSYAPWGRSWHQPYADVARKFPEIRQYCDALVFRKKAAYKIKQIAKSYVERKLWLSPAIVDHMKTLEGSSSI